MPPSSRRRWPGTSKRLTACSPHTSERARRNLRCCPAPTDWRGFRRRWSDVAHRLQTNLAWLAANLANDLAKDIAIVPARHSERRAVMAFNVNFTRRSVLKAGAATTFASSSWMGLTTAFAQQAKPLSFQLSWIKSIQYGGFIAGLEQGSFKKFGTDPTFVSGGPNVDPVANVASGQSQLGDRPVGP